MIVLCSGGFDPLHVGHLDYFEDASNHGELFVALNSDDWLRRKKGYVLMPYEDRVRILKALEIVSMVLPVEDDDGTVCQALEKWRPTHFANGGDRTTADPKEHACCVRLGIRELFRIGGGKSRSSSEIIMAVFRDHH